MFWTSNSKTEHIFLTRFFFQGAKSQVTDSSRVKEELSFFRSLNVQTSTTAVIGGWTCFIMVINILPVFSGAVYHFELKWEE